MRSGAFATIAKTVLYEGQVLYPYRPSALKNRQQWNFGTLYPAGFEGEAASLRLEILVESERAPLAEVQLCFLHGGRERIAHAGVAERPLPGAHEFAFDRVRCRLAAEADEVEPGLWKLAVEGANLTVAAGDGSRAAALERALHSAHLRCALARGAFVSAQDPGPRAAAAARCSSRGVYPVLIGEPGERRLLLAAPIILEDYPRIAPQSLGDFCDATEMDEMLALRVLTLAASETAEIASAGGAAAERARGILAQCAAEKLQDVHGAMSPWDPWAQPPESVTVGGRTLKAGDRVRLHPRPGADIFDRFLDGKTACIQAIEQDLEGAIQVAVVAEDDPGRDLGELKQSGHRFFFTLAEIEAL